MAILIPFFAKGEMPALARVSVHLAGVLTAAGGLIFFLPLIIDAGGFLPDSIEWPIGNAGGIAPRDAGNRRVALPTRWWQWP